VIAVVSSALAGPILAPEAPIDGLARCVADADTLAGALPADLGATDGPQERVAVVVGVPCHRQDTLPSLAYASRDAVRVAEVLVDSGFTVLPLTTVVDRDAVLAALDRAEALVAPGGTLLVYFSGHGVLREEGGRVRRYLVMSDTALDALGQTALEVRSLEYRLDQAHAANRVLVQDTCFAARPGGKSVGSEAGAKGFGAFEPPLRLRDGDLRLYASRFYEQALESPDLGGSVYTAHLLGALAEPAADLDGDSCVGLVEAHRWATRRTSEARDGFQVPQLESRRASNALLGCRPSAPSRAVVVDRPGQSDEQVRITAPGRSAEVYGAGEPVPPGSYRLQVEQLVEADGELVPERVLDARTRLSAGEWLELEDEVAERSGFVAAQADVRVTAASDAYSAVAMGASLWATPRDTGRGRLVAGGSARLWRGGGPEPTVLLGTTGEALAWLGWSWTLPAPGPWRAGLGPTIGAGAVGRAKASADDPEQALFDVGSIGEVDGRLWVGRGRFVGSLSVGVRSLLEAVDSSPEPGGVTLRATSAPVLTVGVGARL
jgi:Caspase domain